MILAACFAIITGAILPMDFVLHSNVQSFTNFVASIAPGVSVMSEKAVNPARAGLTWAVQWLFLPFYLFMAFACEPITTKEYKEQVIKHTRNVASLFKYRLLVVTALFIIASFILSDFGVINGISFFRCSIFLGDIAELTRSLRAPFTSNIGMIFYAWFMPLGVTWYYWLFSALLLNFRLFVIRLPLPESKDNPPEN